MEKFKSAFIAFPNLPLDLVSPIQIAARAINSIRQSVAVSTWPQLTTFGAFIPDDVRHAISKSDVFVCDVTRPNLNVYYEMGFAIGLGKAIAPIINASFSGAVQDAQKDGFFDNVGYEIYEN